MVTAEQITALEGNVAQLESTLSACRVNKKNAQMAVKDGTARIKAIDIEVRRRHPSISINMLHLSPYLIILTPLLNM